MLAKYFWNLVLLAWVSSWRAANGLEGAVLAGILMVWPGVLTFVSGDTRWDKASNWAISFFSTPLLHGAPCEVAPENRTGG
jgi:hypothetical protein